MPDAEDNEAEDDEAEEDEAEEDDDADDAPPRDPRGGLPTADPVVADDWQTQVHMEREIVYDVPPDWEVYPHGNRWVWEVDLPDRENLLRYPVNAPTTYQDEFCGPETFRAMIGTTGSRGAVSTEDAAGHNAENYVVAAFDPDLAGDWEDQPPEPFENSQGFTGHLAVSEASGYPYDEDDQCAAPSGKVYAVSYLTTKGEIITWILAMTTNVDDELDQGTVDQILDSIRTHNP